MPNVSLPAFITINEAVTWLAYGNPRPAEISTTVYIRENQKLQSFIDACLEEVNKKKKFSAFPKRLPTQPLSALLAELESVRGPYPASFAPLLRNAKRLSRDRRKRDLRCAEALDSILEGARSKKLTLWGCISSDVGARVEQIALEFLLRDVTVDWSLKHLALAPGPGPTSQQRAIIAERGKFADAYWQVRLARIYFVKHFNLRVGQRDRSGVQKTTDTDIEKWYFGIYLPSRSDLGKPSIEDEDMKAARDRFDLAPPKLRDLIRMLRKKQAIKRGRRPKKSRSE